MSLVGSSRRAETRSRPLRRHREHGIVRARDRAELERSGWRTTLEYRENHVRARSGRLEQLEVVWHAEAEREGDDGVVHVVVATGSSIDVAWSRLRCEADLAEVRRRRRLAASL